MGRQIRRDGAQGDMVGAFDEINCCGIRQHHVFTESQDSVPPAPVRLEFSEELLFRHTRPFKQALFDAARGPHQIRPEQRSRIGDGAGYIDHPLQPVGHRMDDRRTVATETPQGFEEVFFPCDRDRPTQLEGRSQGVCPAQLFEVLESRNGEDTIKGDTARAVVDATVDDA
ncbi:hypothetical protein [Mycobacterium sp.]|uniref:hypothetical protein n=1 Tax=Mycobacterium sp. TaxID=1785 RepID=UPI002CC967F4|nr:hypothetical protein [Mycobacterium sp.]HKP43045.1 hypothetical protein [Mycobacterium sp.]